MMVRKLDKTVNRIIKMMVVRIRKMNWTCRVYKVTSIMSMLTISSTMKTTLRN